MGQLRRRLWLELERQHSPYQWRNLIAVSGIFMTIWSLELVISAVNGHHLGKLPFFGFIVIKDIGELECEICATSAALLGDTLGP